MYAQQANLYLVFDMHSCEEPGLLVGDLLLRSRHFCRSLLHIYYDYSDGFSGNACRAMLPWFDVSGRLETHRALNHEFQPQTLAFTSKEAMEHITDEIYLPETWPCYSRHNTDNYSRCNAQEWEMLNSETDMIAQFSLAHNGLLVRASDFAYWIRARGTFEWEA